MKLGSESEFKVSNSIVCKLTLYKCKQIIYTKNILLKIILVLPYKVLYRGKIIFGIKITDIDKSPRIVIN